MYSEILLLCFKIFKIFLIQNLLLNLGYFIIPFFSEKLFNVIDLFKEFYHINHMHFDNYELFLIFLLTTT